MDQAVEAGTVRSRSTFGPGGGIEYRDAAALNAHPRNSKVHPEGQVREIAAAIRQWGWTMPVLIDEADTIIAGHGRVMGATLIYSEGGTITMASGEAIPAGMVPVMVARGWSDAQKRAYIIADNKITENGEWNDEVLRLELADLMTSEFDLALTGFSKDELAGLSIGIEALDKMPVLADGERSPFREMMFVVLADQQEVVNAALKIAAAALPDDPDAVNQNRNGNALAMICKEYLERRA